jgi:hypothetical protein
MYTVALHVSSCFFFFFLEFSLYDFHPVRCIAIMYSTVADSIFNSFSLLLYHEIAFICTHIS